MPIVKKILSIFFRIAISIALLVFIFRRVDEKSIVEMVVSSDKRFLLLAFAVSFAPYILCLYRWEMLLSAAKINLPFKRVVISYAGGIFFNMFLPSTIGGDVMRSIDLSQHTKRPREVVATVLLDRLSGYVGLVLLALLSLSFGWQVLQDKSVMFSVVVVIAALAAILMILFNNFLYSRIGGILDSPRLGRIGEMIKNLHQEIYYFRDKKQVILKNILLSFLIQSMAPIASYFIALSLGIRISPVYFFIFLPIIGAITLLPISLGGLGLRDAMTIFFFAKVGVGKDLAFAMSLLSFSFILIYGLSCGLIYLATARYRKR
jgi:glycosyltransferase 2 family protein